MNGVGLRPEQFKGVGCHQEVGDHADDADSQHDAVYLEECKDVTKTKMALTTWDVSRRPGVAGQLAVWFPCIVAQFF